MTEGLPSIATGGCDEEPELLRAVQSGEMGARERLWALLQREGTRVLRRYGVPEKDHAELLQLAMESALRVVTREGWQPTSSLAGFLKWRTRGVLSAWWRKERRHGMETSATGFPEDVAGNSPDPASVVEWSELAARIVHCRERIPPKLRSSWSLRYEQGLELEEIASRLKERKGTVAVHIFRANQIMRPCLSDGGFQP